MNGSRYQVGSLEEAACSACQSQTLQLYAHPMFNIPLCIDCNWEYHSGEFTVDEGNEIYCRWCGAGVGELLLCDVCPKAFCSRCVENNFGTAELERIKGLSDRWCCFVCSPQSFRDLCVKNGWKGTQTSEITTPFNRGVCNDISRGREKYEIPVINEIDYELAPMNFTYVTQPVAGEGAKLNNNPNFFSCCSCTDNCSNPLTCECIINSGGISYDSTGRLLLDKPSGIYECNYRCACNVNRCRNRVVSKGPSIRLEVFRCEIPAKGWGVRCRQPIPAGTFICDYLGEVLPESELDRRGEKHGDEYLYDIDCWGTSQGCLKKSQLGLKRSLSVMPRQYFVDVTLIDKEHLLEYFDEDLVKKLDKHGAIDNMLEAGKKLREKEKRMKKHNEDLRREQMKQQELDEKATAFAQANEFSDEYDGIDFSLPFYSDSSPEKPVTGKRVNVVQRKAPAAKKTKSGSATQRLGNAATEASDAAADDEVKTESLPVSWYDLRLRYSQKEWSKARTVISDRAMNETEYANDSFSIDAKWYGNIARFINHSCGPNLKKVMVFCDTHDVRTPRVAFFALDQIPANTELCYDYDYQKGKVHGKHRDCLCGSSCCRQTLY